MLRERPRRQTGAAMKTGSLSRYPANVPNPPRRRETGGPVFTAAIRSARGYPPICFTSSSRGAAWGFFTSPLIRISVGVTSLPK